MHAPQFPPAEIQPFFAAHVLLALGKDVGTGVQTKLPPPQLPAQTFNGMTHCE
jgi:hypothetical protein